MSKPWHHVLHVELAINNNDHPTHLPAARAGGHVNFSNNATRAYPTGWDAIQAQCEKLGKKHAVGAGA